MRYLPLFEDFHQININLVLKAYFEAALWTVEEQLQEQDNEDFEDMYGSSREDSDISEFVPEIDINIFNIHDDSKMKAYDDVKKFLDNEEVKVAIFDEEIDEEQLGHDIWLSRNGHGAGFFDHNYYPENEEVLMNMARSLGSSDVYIGGDKKIHLT